MKDLLNESFLSDDIFENLDFKIFLF